MSISKYSAGLISQSFWFIETKKIINLIYNKTSSEEIKNICIYQNLFGVSKEYRAKRIYGYLWSRIKGIDGVLIDLFMDSDVQTQKLVNLILILKHDRLFFDFIYEVYREKVMLGDNIITAADLNVFFKNKGTQSETVEKFVESTKHKLGSAYLNFMVEANLLTLINNQRTVTPPIIDNRLENYLIESGNDSFLKAITGVY